MMQKPVFLGVKSLDQLRCIRGPMAGPAKSIPGVNSRPLSDSISLGAFANLKMTAEKLIKEQASVKTDLEMANSKLKKSAEQIHLLEVKLQEATNENAKFKVKQKEDAKLWNSLDSKLSSTKMWCDQLTETLQHLAGCTRDAEKDKKFFEEKLLKSSKAFEDLGFQLNDLSAKLDNAEKTIRDGKQKMIELEDEKTEIEKNFKEQCCMNTNLMKERDGIVKQLKDTVEADKVHLQSLVSQIEESQHELVSKDNICKNLRSAIRNLEEEKNALQSSNEDFSRQLLVSSKETENLEDALHGLLKKVEEMDKFSLTISDNVMRLFSSFETFDGLIHQEKDSLLKNAQNEFDRLHLQFQIVSSENESFKSEVETLKNKIVELEKAQEFIMVQHAEECRLVEDKVRQLKSEIDSLVSKKNELELFVTQLEEKNSRLSEVHSLADSQLQDLLVKASKLESENQDTKNKMQLMLMEKAQEINNFQNEIATHRQHIVSLENQINELLRAVDEKDQCNLQLCEREKVLEEQKSEIQASLAAAECRIIEEKKQYALTLETKQLELSKHLKEISQKNDQAINDMRRKYEMEKLEIVNTEKEKIDKLIKDIERKCDAKLAEGKEEAKQNLIHIQEEHDALINQIRQEYDRKDSNLRSFHGEELQRVQLQAEIELREKTSFMRKEHEIQMQVLRHQLEDEYRKLEEELDILKSKEDKQRALLQLQWKVMDENSQQNEVEVSSKKKEYSVSSMKMRDMDIGNRSQLVLTRDDNGRKEVDLSGIMRTPVANMMKKMDKGNKSDAINVPKHRKKVTHHEYEIETSNGRTITKRRKTKSTVMFGEPTEHKRANLRTPKAAEGLKKPSKVHKGTHTRPSNIGDLFSEGSLNPYTDDPYAFD